MLINYICEYVMTLYEYWKSLSEKEKQEFCEKSGYAYNHMNIHLIHGRKTPPLNKIKDLVEASLGKLQFNDLCDFFANSKTKTPSGN